MFIDLRREKPEYCLESLKDLEVKCQENAQKFKDTKRKTDKFYFEILLDWSNECNFASHKLRTAMDNEQLAHGEFDREMDDLPAYKEIPRIIGQFRAATFAQVTELKNLLPANNPIRVQSEKRLNEAINLLIRDYNISIEEIQRGKK